METTDTQRNIKQTIKDLFLDRNNVVFHSILNGMAVTVGNYKTDVSVTVADSGYVSGYFNKATWDALTEQEQDTDFRTATAATEQKQYLLIKEALRLLLEHPVRRPEQADKKMWRDASDVLIDDSLNRYMGYSTNLLPPDYQGRRTIEEVYEWVKDNTPPPPPDSGEGDGDGKGKGEKSDKKGKGSGGEKSDDDSDEEESDGKSDSTPEDEDKDEPGDGSGSDEDESEPEDAPDDVSKSGLEKLVENTVDRSGTDEKVETISKQAGSESSTLIREYKKKKIIKKPRWDRVIKVWTRETTKTGLEESWIRQPIHLDALLRSVNGRMPGNRMVEHSVKKGKVPVVCYADVSGSCTSYFQRFMAAALTIPLDKFDVHLRSFDTVVRVLERKKLKTPAGGGTDVRPVVVDYYKLKKQVGRDLHCFVITDGYFSLPDIKEEDQKMFHWFLTSGGTKNNIPKGCKIYDLEDFE